MSNTDRSAPAPARPSEAAAEEVFRARIAPDPQSLAAVEAMLAEINAEVSRAAEAVEAGLDRAHAVLCRPLNIERS